MSSEEIAIEARDLSKAYFIYDSPADRLKQAVMPRLRGLLLPLLRAIGRGRGERRYFREHWALRALDFEVRRGETVGIIGRNGSGKSTLLQIVCGTLTPSTGEAQVRGRVAALLELGSGFNPEYTGRENVYLNASVLGLTREETEARMDSILAFADIGDFIDQPVKTYSSGMAMRLAFAVIAHVDADILIIDEALAVGDAYFQQKCFRWLHKFRENGTILFCGHDMAAVVGLCDHAIWLDKGELRMKGPAKQVAEAYSSFIAVAAMGLKDDQVKLLEGPVDANPQAPGEGWQPIPPSSEFGSGLARITHVRLSDADGRQPMLLHGGEELLLEVRIEASATIDRCVAGFTLKDRLGQPTLSGNMQDAALFNDFRMEAGAVGEARMRFVLPHLASGPYMFALAFASGTQDQHVQHHWVHEALAVTVQNPRNYGSNIVAPLTEAALVARDPLAGG
ncbi:ABC transporter ATP-binding protein [Rhodovarius crocodyli]|uniref:ABC transporter ATP-binding protein n=1 Tax=Rhodovarius crocodyli TaxID=1979269 RepID=A0A437MM49_9PROT|nr:ABC transporter ATP-binding protein [Rhodovarius crocodyli]RVT98702.1 ABC transporter ATP-binding protein [Rhodovarius crocodyli]